MKLSEFIQQAQQLAGDTDPELTLWDSTAQVELRLDPDADRFDFQITRGDGEVIIEFN